MSDLDEVELAYRKKALRNERISAGLSRMNRTIGCLLALGISVGGSVLTVWVALQILKAMGCD